MSPKKLPSILKQDGMDAAGSRAERVAKSGSDIQLTLERLMDRIRCGLASLIATGRTPNTDSLNVSARELPSTKRGFIKVNEKLETNVPGIYALGDTGRIRVHAYFL